MSRRKAVARPGLTDAEYKQVAAVMRLLAERYPDADEVFLRGEVQRSKCVPDGIVKVEVEACRWDTRAGVGSTTTTQYFDAEES